jgi:outer membrane protein TolC
VTRRNRDLLAQLTDVAEARYRAGTATQQDVLRASVEMNKLDNDLIGLEQRRVTASAMLNRLVDRRVDAPLPVPPARDPDPLSLELDAVLAMAGQSNPDIARVRERIEGFRQRLELARLNRWPDLTLSFSYNLVENDGLSPVANGDDQWWVGAGINLPIWADRLDAAESEAARGIFESIAALGDVQNRVAFRVQDALVRAESQQRQVVLFRDVIIPQARQTVDASLSGYRAGKLDFLTLVDNWRRLFEFEVIYHQDLAALKQSLADLQQAVGRDLGPTADAGAAVQELQP